MQNVPRRGGLDGNRLSARRCTKDEMREETGLYKDLLRCVRLRSLGVNRFAVVLKFPASTMAKDVMQDEIRLIAF